MATSTYNESLAGQGKEETAKAGIFNRFFRGIVEIQTAKARVITADFLSGVSDQELLSYGWEPEDIKRLRNR